MKSKVQVRLYLKDSNGEWRPNKRIEPNKKISAKRKRIYEKRMLLSQKSFEGYKVAKKENNFSIFVHYMDPIIKDYEKILAPSLLRKSLGKMKREIYKLAKK